MCTPANAIRSYAQLRAGGVTRRALAAALAQGSLVRLRRGVYGDSRACPAVAASAAHGGVLACVSAARHLGIWVLDREGPPHVWMGRGGRRYHPRDCACIEHWDDGPPLDGFGMPSVPRILRQILRCRGVETFFAALESARRQRMIDGAGLRWLHESVGAAGREAIALSRTDADSGLESLFRWRLRGRGLAIRTQVHIAGVGRVDALVDECLLVELDGDENHDDASRRHRDRMRDAVAAAWGYVPLRFDYAMVVHDWPTVEAAVLGAVDAGRHLWHPPRP